MAIKVRYIPNQAALDNYYWKQSGKGGDGQDFFQGPLTQRGHGLAGLFGKIFRAAVPVFKGSVQPMLKKGAKAVAKQALTTGMNVANDMLSGESGSKSIGRRLPMAARKLSHKGVRALHGMISNNVPHQRKGVRRVRKTGRGRRRGRKFRKRTKTIKGRDIFY